MDLYLVRHGIAFEPDSTQWPDDKGRPLTPEGEKKFRQAARGLRELVPSVSVVLSSPWARAWRTAELLEKEARWPAPVACEALESGRSPAEALQALQPFDPSAGVVLVGHEPNMHELASYLLTADTGHAQMEFRKGGVAYLQLGDGPPRPGMTRLVWLLTPKALRLIGR
jgi:phosphohistidine phosphatase